MKRILVVAVAAILAWCGFTFFSNHAGAEAHDAEHGHEHEHEEVDFDNIPLSQKQVDAVDLKMGEAVDRVMDATIAANGQLVLRAQNKGDVASLMGGVVKAIYVKEGQNVKRGQVVALVENTDVVSLQREYYSASKECELALADLERQKLLNRTGAGVKKNAQQAAKEYHVAHANLIGIGKQLAQMGISSWNPYNIDRSRFAEGNFFGFEIGVGIPLFYGSTKAKVKAAQKDRELAEIEMRQEQTEKERDFRLCTKRLQAASNRLKYYEQNNQAHSAQISKLSAIEYENGEISYVEYVNAIEETIAVLMKHADAINEYNQAVIAIQRLTGMM